jgi:hydrogenase expression/formation protein
MHFEIIYNYKTNIENTEANIYRFLSGERMDLEGYVRRCLRKKIPENKIIEDGFKRILEIKEDVDEEFAKKFIKAILEEVKTTEKFKEIEDENLKTLLRYPESKVTMGKMGVGSRGEGDFFVHREIARIVKSTKVSLRFS